MRYLLIAVLFIQIACSSSAQQITTDIQDTKPERKLLQKSSATMKSPKDYLHRNRKGGKEYDPKPQVVEVNKKEGKYELRWIGYDGKEKIIAYQRADAIDALVEARIEKKSKNELVYKYLIKNLPTSPTYFSSFTVQTLTNDVKTVEPDDVYIGEMFNQIRGFNIGKWVRFAPLNETTPKIEAGKNVEFSLTSSALPGIVGCRATAGEITLKGVGEHMPQELENVMPGYEEWAKGYTIGPIKSLSSLSDPERAKYLLDNLPKFLEAGWITEDGVKRYEPILKRKDLQGAFAMAKKDFEKGYITSEVFHIIEGLS